MGYYRHPDTMAIAGAQNAVEKELGANADCMSLEYSKAFRKHYELQNRADNGLAGLDEYLAELDQDIAWKEEGKTDEEIRQIMGRRFHEKVMKGRGMPSDKIKCLLDEKFPLTIVGK